MNKKIIEPPLETHHRSAAKDLEQRRKKTDWTIHNLTENNEKAFEMCICIHIEGTLLSVMLLIIYFF